MKNLPPPSALLLCLGFATTLFCPAAPTGRDAQEALATVEKTPNLLCFWSFQGSPGGHLTSKGKYAYTLLEKNGAIARSENGIFGTSSLLIKKGQWLMVPRKDCPGLDLHGESQVSMVAWIQRQNDGIWQYIAGMWNERDSLRQYALFSCGHMQTDYTTMERTPARRRVMGYVSDLGGATQGRPYCFSYATGGTELKENRWHMIAFTYDRKTLRVYLDGVLDSNGNSNPFPWAKPIFDGGEKGSDFTVAQRALPRWPGYPKVEAPTHGEGFGGLLGGLAVFDRCLSAEELVALQRVTMRGAGQ